MGKRGPKPKGKVKIKWSPKFAYAIGLLVTDGNLSPDLRHLSFTSKDIQLAKLFQKSLGIQGKIGRKANSTSTEKKYFVVQFSDVLFYQFLTSIGLSTNKSKTIGAIKIPPNYFFDFLRGSFDGDGSSYSYFDPRWKSSFMFYLTFLSASQVHIIWLRKNIRKHIGVHGHISKSKNNSVFSLRYAKREALKIIPHLYHGAGEFCLSRKRLKIQETLRIIGERL